MAEEFSRSVDDGIRLSKRIYFGKDRAVAPPKPMTAMEKLAEKSYLPTSVMLYAVISDPVIVDNPDIPSYQPHVHGRCDPPALIPLQMNGISLEADCFLDTALITVSGSWRVHCVKGSKSCDCLIAIPMGEQGSILGVEVEVHGNGRTYCSQVSEEDEKDDSEKLPRLEDGSFLTPHIYTLTLPQVDGGSYISLKVRWSQKLLYDDAQFTLNIPFSFPEFVTPAGKIMSKKEKINLKVNCGPGMEILCKTTSHPLKELKRQAEGKLGFSYEAEVLTWSNFDFAFTYMVVSKQTSGGVLLQSPSPDDVDQREMFCCYLFPERESKKVFRKEVVFVVDISGSMREKPLEDTKNALFSSLAKLDVHDVFSVIAFNDQTYLFSTSLVPATTEAYENVIQWINMNFVAGGGTNILAPLTQAMEMFSGSSSSIPAIFLITDGAVEDEKHICEVIKARLPSEREICPRIYTLGIGSFCNHYFLRMLAIIGHGHHDAVYDADSIEGRVEGLFARFSSTILVNISFENLHDLDGYEVYPSQIPDLSSECPLIVSGRYRGTFPDTLIVKGVSADMNKVSIHVKVQEAKDTPLNMVLAKQEIELLTAEAWCTENKDLERKIAKMSVQTSTISEFTKMTLIENERVVRPLEPVKKQQAGKKIDPQKTEVIVKPSKIIVLQGLGVGFGNLSATAENIPPGSEETKTPEAAEILVKAASNCCGRLCDCCCCPCCISLCSRLNDQCVFVLTQLCGALACLGCYGACNACCDACCSGQDQ